MQCLEGTSNPSGRPLAFIRLATAVLLMSAGHAAGQDNGDVRTDWVSREALTPEQAAELPTACCGRFIEPVREDEHADTAPEDAPTVIDAPAGFSQPSQGELHINGPVGLLNGYRSVSASESATLRENEETVSLQGNVEFREPGLLLRGNSAFIDQVQETTSLDDAGFLLYESGIHGQAAGIHYDGETGRITINNSALSRCEPGNEFWVLQSRDLQIDSEAGMAYARDVTLRIRDVPVFRYPYTLPFPITDERASGFLAPSLSTRRRGGLDIATPYYFNLAPNYDATLTPRIISQRGPMLEGEFRHLSDWSTNTVNGAWMPDDALYDPALAGQPSDSSPPVNSRWFAGMEHEGMIGDQLRTMIDFNAVSDRDYFRDMGSSGLNLDNRSHLNREGSAQWFGRNWQSTARVQRIEVIDPLVADRDINRPYDRMPEFTVSGSQPLPGGLEFSLASGFSRFDRDLNPERLSDTEIENGALVTGERTVVESRISRPWRTPGTFLIPTLVHHYTRYNLEDQAPGTMEQPERDVTQFSLDGGLIFERPLELSGDSFLQTLEPRLYYLYSEHEEQQSLPTFDTTQRYLGFEQLFRRNRFGGHDRIGDADQISAAVTTRFLDDQGRERARAELGQIFYFEDRQVSPDSLLQQWEVVQPLQRNRSALVGRAGYSLSDNWSARTDLQWSQQRQRVEEGAFSLRYQRDRDHIINIGYRYREKADFELDRPTVLDPQIRQTDISAVWPMNDNWRFIGRWNYDHSNKRNLESFAGVEYSNCCTTMRVLVRDWVNDYEYLDSQARPNRGIYFQFTLHGLGNVTGASISDLLSDGIPGFREYPSNE
ncbi:MAG: LPS assembly protein LptD [Pseudohongiellaceae bacterium]